MIAQTFTSICSGAGGFDKGAIAAGLTSNGAFEIDQHACDMYPLITGCFKIEQADLTKYPLHKLPRANGLIGGVPCQEFSDAGKRAGSTGARNLFPVAIKALSIMEPDWFIFENVPGLLKGKNKPYFENVVKELTVLGYRTEHRILCAADFGVPQTRHRVFIVGHRSQEWSWPAATHFKKGAFGLRPWVSWNEALSEWIKTALPGKLPLWITKKYPVLLFPTLPTDGYFSGENLRVSRNEIPLNSPACTVTASDHHRRRIMRNSIVYNGDEDSAAILQNLPPGVGLTHREIGNAVPPLLALRVFEAMFCTN